MSRHGWLRVWMEEWLGSKMLLLVLRWRRLLRRQLLRRMRKRRRRTGHGLLRLRVHELRLR